MGFSCPPPHATPSPSLTIISPRRYLAVNADYSQTSNRTVADRHCLQSSCTDVECNPELAGLKVGGSMHRKRILWIAVLLCLLVAALFLIFRNRYGKAPAEQP